MKKFIDTFLGRFVCAGIFNLIVIGIFSLFLSIASYTIDQGIIYATLISLFVWIIAEPIIATINHRKISPSELIGASIFGSIFVGFVVTAVLLLCKVII